MTHSSILECHAFFGAVNKPMRIARLILLSLLLLGGMLVTANAGERPNILVIVADDLGHGDLGLTGSSEISTSVIDGLAGNGVVVNNGYVVHPYCGPSRAGLLTGRYPARFGMEFNVDYSPYDEHLGLPKSEITIADRMRQAGYQTGLIGKWHLGAAPPFHPNHRGFDYFYGFLGGGHSYFPENTSVSWPLTNPDGSPNISARAGYYLPLVRNGRPAEFDEYLTTALSRDAAKFVSNADKPFFLVLSYNAPHEPLEAPEELVEQYSHIEDPERRTYAAMIHAMDDGIGMVLDALRTTGKFDNTLIFFLSEHGGVYPEEWMSYADWADSSPYRRGKVSLTEGGIHVPFVVHWPAGLPSGRKFDGLVSTLDIAATAIAVADGDSSDGLLEGKNLVPYLTGESPGSPHEALFWRFAEGDHIWAVRTPDAKYMQQMLPGVGRAFFDMTEDPFETRNIVDQYPERQAELARLWNEWNSKNIQNVRLRPEDYGPLRQKFFDDLHEESVRNARDRPTFEIE